MRRFLTLALALVLLCSTACAETLLPKQSRPELFPVADGAKLQVWCGQDGNITAYAVNPENAELEALTGVKIDWITAPGTQADMNVMFNLHIASGNYPDLYMNSYGTGDIITYANDVFIPLNEYIENTTWIKQYLEDMPELKEAVTAPDGNIYCLWKGLPAAEEESDYNYPFKLFIYQPWLDAAGLAVPATIDEYREVLRYFRDHDMNGNGDPTDELPMLGSYAFDHDGSDPTYPIMSAFQLITSDYLWYNEDKTVECVAVTDAYREGLIYLNSMYAEGLIPEDIYALTLNEFRDVVNVPTAERMVVGSAGGPAYARICNTSIFGERAYDEWTIVTGLKKDADTEAQLWARRSAPTLYGAVTTACKDPQLAIDWIDACIDPEIAVPTNRGIEGIDWVRRSADGALPIVIETLSDDLKRGGSQNNVCFGSWVFPAIPAKYIADVYVEGTGAYKNRTNLTDANNRYREVARYDARPLVSWCTDTDVIDEKAALQTTIESAISTAYAEFVLGRKDVGDDAVWAAYIANLNELGLARYLEVSEIYAYGE